MAATRTRPDRTADERTQLLGWFDLDAPGSTALHSVGEASLRWMLLHMLEETARHAGHLDLVREMLDGETGYY